MTRLPAVGAGFLLAVLWFDLMFDVQVLQHREAALLPEAVLASIAAYYRRVTTDAGMSWLVASAMLATVASLAWQMRDQSSPFWLRSTSLVTCLVPVSLAIFKIVPDAVRLGARGDSLARQSELARSICHLHLLAFAMIAGLIALQLYGARGRAAQAREP